MVGRRETEAGRGLWAGRPGDIRRGRAVLRRNVTLGGIGGWNRRIRVDLEEIPIGIRQVFPPEGRYRTRSVRFGSEQALAGGAAGRLREDLHQHPLRAVGALTRRRLEPRRRVGGPDETARARRGHGTAGERTGCRPSGAAPSAGSRGGPTVEVANGGPGTDEVSVPVRGSADRR